MSSSVQPTDRLLRGMQRLSFNKEGQPIEYGKDLYRGDRFRFVTEIAPPES